MTHERSREGGAGRLFRCRRHARSPARAEGRRRAPTTRSPSNLLDEGQFGAPILLTPFNYAQGPSSKASSSPPATTIGNWSFYGNRALSKAHRQEHQLRRSSISTRPSSPISPATTSTSTTTRPIPLRPASNTRVPTTRTLFSADLAAGSGLQGHQPGRAPRTGPACPATSR